MSSDLWGQVSPPKWLSSYETSLLNAQEGRAAAASFNTAWNSSYGKAQQGGIESKQSAQNAKQTSDRDAQLAKLQADADVRRRDLKLDTEQKERTRIGGEWNQVASSERDSIIQRRLDDFKQKLAPFMQSLSPLNQPPSSSPYGSPGGPGASNGITPWRSAPLSQATNPNPTGWSNSKFFSDEESPITGESGPFDPTYEDYQRAKSEHPGLWLDPVTAPTMSHMDQSWNQMEKIRMESEQAKDQHRAFEVQMEAKNIAMDVGAQGINRFGFREDAYHKAPSEIQMQVDSLPNGGRYPKDDPTSQRLGFSPLTSAGENILNNYLSSNGKLRIDGANRDELDRREASDLVNKAPGSIEQLTIGPKGKTYKITPPGAGRSKESDIGTLMREREEKKKAGTLTPDDELIYNNALEKHSSASSGKEGSFLELQSRRDKYRKLGMTELADEINDRIHKLNGTETADELRKISDNLDVTAIKDITKQLGKSIYSGTTEASRKSRQALLDEKDRIMGQITDRHVKKPKQDPAPKGWKMTPGGEWMRPDTDSAPVTAPNAAPTAAPTNAAPKLSQADKDKALKLANEAYQRNPDQLPLIQKRLESLGIQFTK